MKYSRQQNKTFRIVSALWAQAVASMPTHKMLNARITLRITSTSGSQEWCFEIIHNILIR